MLSNIVPPILKTSNQIAGEVSSHALFQKSFEPLRLVGPEAQFENFLERDDPPPSALRR